MNLALLKAQMKLRELFTDEKGDTNIISIIIILVVVIGLALMFSGYITDLAEDIWTRIFDDASEFI